MTAKLITERSHPSHQVRQIAREPQQARPQLLHLVRGHSRRHLLLFVALAISSMTHAVAAITPRSHSAVPVQRACGAGSS